MVAKKMGVPAPQVLIRDQAAPLAQQDTQLSEGVVDGAPDRT